MFPPRIYNLVDAKHLTAEHVSDNVDVSVCVRESNVHSARKSGHPLVHVVQTLSIYGEADKRGKCREGRSGESRHQLIGNDH